MSTSTKQAIFLCAGLGVIFVVNALALGFKNPLGWVDAAIGVFFGAVAVIGTEIYR